jgi:hypothetical protein
MVNLGSKGKLERIEKNDRENEKEKIPNQWLEPTMQGRSKTTIIPPCLKVCQQLTCANLKQMIKANIKWW